MIYKTQLDCHSPAENLGIRTKKFWLEISCGTHGRKKIVWQKSLAKFLYKRKRYFLLRQNSAKTFKPNLLAALQQVAHPNRELLWKKCSGFVFYQIKIISFGTCLPVFWYKLRGLSKQIFIRAPAAFVPGIIDTSL